MLKDSFYEYGSVTKIFTYIVFSMITFMYIFKVINEFASTNIWEEFYYVFVLLLLFVLIAKFFWYLINKTPITTAINLWGSICLRLNTMLLYLVLFIFCITNILFFLTNSYSQFELDINCKLDYKIFNIPIIPFSVIRLIGDVVANYTCLDLLSGKLFLSKINKIILVFILPILSFLYFIQTRFYNKRLKERLPEKF